MKVDHVTFSKSGGAGRVASILSKEQSKLGFDSRLVAYYQGGLSDDPIKHPLLTVAAILDRQVTSRLGGKQLTSLFRSRIQLLKNVDIRDDSVLHLHWMSGVADLKRLIELGLNKRRIIWTLHDMAPFTGFCHQSEDCRGFQTGCEECPFAHPLVQGLISLQFKSKMELIENFPRLTLVAPSGWMKNLAKSALMFKGLSLETVENPVSNEFFEVGVDTRTAREILGLDPGLFVVAQIASDLLDPNKQVEKCAEVLAELGNSPSFRYRHLLIGANGNRIANRFPSTLYLGTLGASDLASALMASDILLSTSIAESAGLTILEAAALAKPAIVMGRTGSLDQLLPEMTGIVANDWDGLRVQLLRLQENPELVNRLGKAAKLNVQKHAPELIAERYTQLYNAEM